MATDYMTDSFKVISQFFTELINLIIPGTNNIPNTLMFPIFVTSVVFGAMIYIAFRFFIFERLMKSSEGGAIGEVPSHGLSILFAVLFAFLGIYLGFIPFIATILPAFVIVLIGVFIFIIGFGVHSMYIRQKGEHWEDVGNASEKIAAGMEKDWTASQKKAGKRWYNGVARSARNWDSARTAIKQMEAFDSAISRADMNIKEHIQYIDRMIAQAKLLTLPNERAKAAKLLVSAVSKLGVVEDAANNLRDKMADQEFKTMKSDITIIENGLTKARASMARFTDPASQNLLQGIINELEEMKRLNAVEQSAVNAKLAEVEQRSEEHMARLKNDITLYYQNAQTAKTDVLSGYLATAHTAITNLYNLLNYSMTFQDNEVIRFREHYATKLADLKNRYTQFRGTPAVRAAAIGGAPPAGTPAAAAAARATPPHPGHPPHPTDAQMINILMNELRPLGPYIPDTDFYMIKASIRKLEPPDPHRRPDQMITGVTSNSRKALKGLKELFAHMKDSAK